MRSSCSCAPRRSRPPKGSGRPTSASSPAARRSGPAGPGRRGRGARAGGGRAARGRGRRGGLGVEQLAGALYDEQRALQARRHLVDEGRAVVGRAGGGRGRRPAGGRAGCGPGAGGARAGAARARPPPPFCGGRMLVCGRSADDGRCLYQTQADFRPPARGVVIPFAVLVHRCLLFRR